MNQQLQVGIIDATERIDWSAATMAQGSATFSEVHTSIARPIHTRKHMAQRKKADDELGSIVEVSGSFRVEVKLFGRTRASPMRVEHRGDARP